MIASSLYGDQAILACIREEILKTFAFISRVCLDAITFIL